MRTKLLISAIILATGTICAATPYKQLESKAQRAFKHSEWASAAALFDLMLEQQPTVTSTYGQAIVANAMRSDTIAETRLMQQALDNHLPFDSVFSQVKKWSFKVGKTHLYEHFLKNTQKGHPWMRRTIDSYLLKYYTFRRNGTEMIEYSKKMLVGAPDNTGFLATLADGYMLTGDETSAIAVYQRILAADSRNFNALLHLGCIYASRPDYESHLLALDYLEKAYAVHGTPYVAAKLKKLRQTKS